MNKPYQEATNTLVQPQTPTQLAFSEIEMALSCLADAVERIGIKTCDIRYITPACQDGMKNDSSQSCSPLVDRLYTIKDYIRRQTNLLNTLSDEIQL